MALKKGGRLKLHKISSDSKSVLMKFPADDLAKDLKDLDIGKYDLSVQRSLGLSWDINADVFTFNISSDQKPFTRRGGFVHDQQLVWSPWICIASDCAREDFIPSNASNFQWSRLGELDDSFRLKCSAWVNSVHHLEDVRIQRMCCKYSVVNHNTRTYTF